MVGKVGLSMKLSRYGKRVVRNFVVLLLSVMLIVAGVIFIKNRNKDNDNVKEPELIARLDDGFVNGLIVNAKSFNNIEEGQEDVVLGEFQRYVKSLQFSVIIGAIDSKEDQDGLKVLSTQAKELGLPMYLINDKDIIDSKDYKKLKVNGNATVAEGLVSFGDYEIELLDVDVVKNSHASANAYQGVLAGEIKGFVFNNYEALHGYEMEVGLIASNLKLLIKDSDDKSATGNKSSLMVDYDVDEKVASFDTLESADQFFSNSKTAQIGFSNKPVIKGARMIAALGSILSDPNNTEVIKATAVKGSEFNVVGSVGSGEDHAYELSTGDYILSKYTEEIPAVKPMTFTGVDVIAENGYEVLKFKDSGSPLPYIFRDNNELVVTFVGSTYEGDYPVIEAGLFQGIEINNRAGNMEIRVPLDKDLSWGYLVDLSDNNIKIRIKENVKEVSSYFQPLNGKTIVLDAGHGGKDPGSLNPNGGKTEAQLNLELSSHIETRLKSLGATVVNTRTTDEFVSLWDRVNIFNDNNGDYFISVHHNASVNRSVNGVEMYYADADFKKMAEGMAKELSSITGRRDRGPYHWIQYVLRSSLGPSVLIEAGFMSEDTEFADLQNVDKQILSAGVVADQIVKDLERRLQSGK